MGLKLYAHKECFNTTSFLKHWHKDAVLNDPSIGSKFKGHDEIQKYFEDYFIGYDAQTKLIKMEMQIENKIRFNVFIHRHLFKGRDWRYFRLCIERQ